MRERSLRAVLYVMFACLGAGCAVPRWIAKDTVDYNVALADAQNEQMLLNIVRASKNHPLYFTEVGSLSRSLTLGGEMSVDAPFGGSADSTFKIPLKATASGGPTANLGVLNNDSKFMRGILQPATLDLLKYFWDQGWPRELLLLMFVHRIEWNGLVYESYLDLDRGAGSHYGAYQEFIRALAYGGYELEDAGEHLIELELDDKTLSSKTMLEMIESGRLKVLTKASGATSRKVQLHRKSYKFSRGPVRKVPAVLDGGAAIASQTLEGPWRSGMGGSLSDGLPNRFVVAADDPESEFRSASVKGDADGGGKFRIFLRSPEAMIYHLGEILRFQNRRGLSCELQAKPSVALGGEKALFRAVKSDSAPRETNCECALAVTYCGKSYAVPTDHASGESMHVLSLMSMIFSLYKSADSLPQSGVVTLVGR